MNYIVYNTFSGITAAGENKTFPRGSSFDTIANFIAYDNKAICVTTSFNAFRHFARNDDGCGLQRAFLFSSIRDFFANSDEDTTDKVNYIKENYPTFINDVSGNIIWTFNFFHADIDDLRNIAIKLGLNIDQVEALEKEVDNLKSENAALNEQLVDTQMAITELYEQLEGGDING